MIYSKKCSNIFNKIIKFTGYIFLTAVLIMLLFSIFATVLMIIKFTSGYCNSWMSEIINFETRTNELMSKLYW